MVEQEHIARISYGKDSLKMLEVIHSRGLPLDRITTTDVWATDTISANLPPMEEFKARMDQRIWELYRIEVEHLCARNPDGSKRTYEQMFYHVPIRKNSQTVQVERGRERERETGSGPARSSDSPISGTPGVRLDSNGMPDCRIQGSIKGFPGHTCVNWCQKLKIRAQPGIPSANLPMVPKTQNRQGQNTFSSERPVRRKDRNIIEYLGIAADEPKRHGQLNDRKRAPLVEFGIDEDLCGLYCQYNDMLAPTYETSCRDGCWFCHNQGVDSLRLLRRDYPERWALLMKWDLDSPISFKADGHTVHDFDRRFQMEDLGLIPTGRTFRWKMLEEPPLFVGFGGEQLSLFERSLRNG
jgi:hypothetical protein